MKGSLTPPKLFPLTTAQREIWLDQLVHGDAPVYKIGGYVQIEGPVDADLFERAVNLLIERHDALRIVPMPSDDPDAVACQGIAETLTVRVPRYDFSTREDPLGAARSWAEQALQRPFPLNGSDPLFRFELLKVDEASYLFTLNFHHLIVDGWAIGLIVDALCRIYSALSAGATDSSTAPSYEEFVEHDEAYRASPAFERQRTYWREKYRTVPDPLFPPRYRDRYGTETAPSGHYALRLTRDLFERIAEFARQRASTPFHVILALLHVYYARTRNKDEIVVGVPILNRPNARLKQVVGMCAGVAAVRLAFDEASPFDTLLQSLGRTLKHDYRHQRFPLSELNRELGLMKSQRAQLFDLSVSYERDDYDLRMGEGRARIVMQSSGCEQLPLMVHIRENPFDDQAWIHFMYNRAWFDDTEIEATAQRLLVLLDQVLENSGLPVGQLTLTTPSERQTLARWSETKAAFASDETIHGRFEQVAASAPDAVAVTHANRSLTYGELNARANRLARRLTSLGVRPDERVAVCAERGIEMIVALLAVLKAGGAYVPLDPAYPAERLAWMLDDSAPVAVLVQESVRARIGQAAAPIVGLDDERLWDGPDDEALDMRVQAEGPERLAYVIYTSGSTGQPKGVMIEHRNVMRLFAATRAWFGFGSGDVWALFHSFAFDFSVWEIWGALLHGGRLVVVPYLTSRSPLECYSLLCGEGVTVLNQTPSAFRQLIAAQGEARERRHRLRLVIFGGEALELRSLTPWFQRDVNVDTRLVNMYGITETTVHVTYRPIAEADVSDRDCAAVNSVGEPIPDLRVYVLDARMQPRPIGVEGELYVGGAGVARGYLNRPELTRARFVLDPLRPDGGERIYRTGDVGRWLPDGTLEYLGRNDDQVKIRGFRIELGEIEAALTSAQGVAEAVVLAREDSAGDKRLVAYYVGAPREPSTLRAHLLARMPEYMAPSAYVRLERFPLTPNGKLDRRALPAPDRREQGGRAYEAPQGPVEVQLARIWAEVLNVERVGRHDHFFELGGHSLLAVKVIEHMRRLGLHGDVKVLFGRPTLEALAAAAGNEPPDDAPTNAIVEGGERITPDMLPLVALDQDAIDRIVAQASGGIGNIQDIYPLAPLQQGILYHHLSASEGDPYVMQVLLRVDSRARLDAFVAALETVVERHDVFRTIVLWEGLDEPVQVVLRQARLQVQEVSFDDTTADVAAALRTRFDPRRIRLDLNRAPLMNMACARDGDAWAAVLLFHHLVDDATSLRLLRREVAQIMRGEGDRLPPQLAYRRYVAQTRSARSALGDRDHETFFREMLGDVTEPTLPYGIADVHGDGRDVKEATHPVSEALGARLRMHARQAGVSVASLFHVAWAHVLGGLSGREDVVFGTVLMGRLLAGGDVDRAMGMFINTLPVRIDVGAVTVRDAVLATHERLSALLSHEHATLVLAQRCSGVAAPLPLFSALLNFRHGNAQVGSAGGPMDWEGIDILDFVERTNYPLTLSVDDLGDAFSLNVQAVEGIDAARVGRYVAEAIARIVHALEDESHRPMNALTFLPEKERHEVLEAFNATAVSYPPGETVHGLFERQAALTPDAIALVFEERSYSYLELNACADALASQLAEYGVAADTRVAICVERSPEMVIGLLAILKAGGAYVPLDPGYPAQRLRYMLNDSAPIALLLHESTARVFDDADIVGIPTIDAGRFADAPARAAPPCQASPAAANHLAYVIYTSGSTGQPKGVMNEHRAVVNRLRWMQDAMGLQASDVVLQKTPFSFDVSVWEFFLPLMAGARLVLARAGGHRDPAYLSELIGRERVTIAHFVPSMLQAFVEHARRSQCASLTRVVCSGEALPGHLLRRFDDALRGCTLYNLYGPTEAAVDVTAWSSAGAALDALGDHPPIGKPISNTRIYILDANGRPSPIGVPGEIHIAGVQVARGYLNRPALTAQKFVGDPFSSAPSARMYRTGDLGRWLPDGNIEYLGRNDDQIKLRGFRIELGEIEAKLAEIEGVREAIVVAREDEPGEKRLVAYVTGTAIDVDALRGHVAAQLPDYMAPAAYVHLDAVPLTPNGKLDRKALPAPERTAYSPRRYEAPREGTEQTLASIWSTLLAVERIGRHDNFFELGGHSLLMIGLIERMRRAELHADIRLLFSAPTLAELAARVEHGRRTATAPPNLIPADAQRITPGMLTLIELGQDAIDAIVAAVPGGAANVQDIYPLAPLQQGILYHHLSTAEGDPYVLHGMFGFDTRERVDDFLAALACVIARHDALRTGIVWEGLDEPVQVVWRRARLDAEEIVLDAASVDAVQALRARFDTRRTRLDLHRPPLMRFVFARDPRENRWLGMLLFHHLALDHAASGIVRQEVQAYMVDPHAALPASLPYREYVARSRLGVGQASHEAFFSDMLGDVDEPTLPYGLGEVRGDGATVREHTEAVPPSLAARLLAGARAVDVSAASVLHAVWGVVLSALAGGREDVVFGTVLLGRFERAEEAGRTVGLFINTLPVRVGVGAQDVRTAVKTTAARLAALLAHEHASLALAQRCSGVAAPAPLFGALLNYRHSDAAMTPGGARETWDGVEMIGSHERTNYPLVLSIDDFGGAFSMTVQAIEGVDAERVTGYVFQALESLIDALEQAPHTPMHALEILPARERERLLETFNDTASAYPAADDTVHALFERQAASTPDAVALVHEGGQCSYRELNALADTLARRLIHCGAAPDERVAVCVERGPEMIVAQLAVLKAGAAYVPLDPGYPPERLRYMLDDSAPVALLMHGRTAALFDQVSLPRVDVGGIDALSQARTAAIPAPSRSFVKAHHLAYVIYTSGSTGRPKGVMVEHRHLVNLVRWHSNAFSLAPSQRTTATAGVGFDASAWEIWPTLCSGASLLLPPASATADPQRLLAWWRAQEVDIGFLVTPLAELAYATGHANPHPRTLLIGGDRLTRWPEGIGSHQTLVNNYGPTETTVVATSGRLGASDATLHIGRPIANARIYILDARGRPVPIGVPGEIHIGGAQVARGYLNRPDLTAEKFVRDPFDPHPSSRMYRTGDLGRWLPDGNLEYLGRADDQVKIRGVRVEPAEIEAVLSGVSEAESVAVIARDDPAGEKRLVAYYTSARETELADELREAAARALPAHMVPADFVHLTSLPLTPNGKLDRKALPAPDTTTVRTHEYVAPIGAAEHTVAMIWAELFGIERVGRHENFFELGGHSLLAVRLVERMRRAGLSADVQTLFATPTVAALALRATGSASAAAGVPPNLIPHDARRITPDMLTLVDLSEREIESIVASVPGGAPNVQDIYPLAALQEGVLYHHLASDRGDAYLLRSRLSFSSRAALDRFVAALRAVVARHDVLRTGIAWEGLRQPVQVVLRSAALRVRESVIDPALGGVYEQLSERFDPRRYRLDIRHAPLMEGHVAYDPPSERWILILLFHHIVLDHTGIDVLLQEVQAHLQDRARMLPAAPLFRDYIAQARSASPDLEHESFFTQMLADVDEPTLPYGLVDVQDGRDAIAQARYELDAELSHRLRGLSKRMGVSAASLFHLAWGHVLGKLAAREDVVFGTVLLGRWQGAEGVERALGLFINTLPIRIRVGAIGVREALLQTQRTLSGLLGHEHAPLALAQRCSGVAAPLPLFSALLNFRHSARQRPGDGRAEHGWQGIEILDGEERTNYPCALSVDDLGDGFSLTAQIINRFDAARVCEYVHRTLNSMADALEQAPDTPVHRLSMLAPAERQQLLTAWNDTDRPFPREAAVHALFELQAAKSPDAPAVVEHGATITYAQLNAHANALARRLRRAGTRPGERVAILLDRSVALIAAELAILKCDATYVPLDSNAPDQRLAYIAKDCGALRVVTSSRFALPRDIDVDRFDIDAPPSDEPNVIEETVDGIGRAKDGDPTAPAYVMYTSGSTGQPKGVVIRHRGVNRLALNNGYADFASGDRIAFTSNPAFDASTMEVWGALLNGACVVVIPHDVLLSPADLASLLQAERVTVLHLVTGLLGAYADALAPVFGGLRYLLTGGDAADVRSIRRIVRNSAPRHFVHCYGPTESTTFATTFELDEWDAQDRTLPIGRPISNTRVYLLDAAGQPAPVGVAGEIHVGGEGVAAGYLNLEALSAERFVPDPFSDAPNARMYRTGDLGRYRSDGNLEFLGRNDAQVKIRGFRIEPGEVEARLAECGLADAMVLARDEADGDKRLVAYYTGAPRDLDALRAQLRATLPEYMVPSAFVALDRLPLTPNGKLDRRALPAPDLAAVGQTRYAEPQGEIERSLARIWAELLSVPRVGRHDNFFALGGHSLLAVRAIGRLRQMFGEAATLRTLFESKDLAMFAAQLAASGATADEGSGALLEPIAPERRGGALPLSFVQERLWLIQQRDGGRAYNMHGALRFDGPLSLPALHAAFDSLVARHEPLRTRFDIAEGDDMPSQYIDAQGRADFDVLDITADELDAALARCAQVVFDLAHGPLLRVRALRIAPTQHVVSLVMHHIVSDGWSMSVLLSDLRALYAAHLNGSPIASALPALAFQYADHASWQRQRDLQKDVAYWRSTLAGYSEPIDLGANAAPIGTGHGALGVVRRRVPSALASAVFDLGRARGTSLFTVCLVGLAILCRRLTGRDDLCIGTTTAGREDPHLEPLIGFFVNILPMRLDLSADPTAADLIDQARDAVLGALEHQALPFERMLALVPELRQTDGRSPVPIMLRHQNVPPIDTSAWGKALMVEPIPDTVERVAQSALDLELFGGERDLEVVANFDRGVFARNQIELMLDVWFELLARLADTPDAHLTALSEMTRAEARFIDRAQAPARTYEDIGIAERFARQVALRPDAWACTFEHERVSFAELDRRANGIAHALRLRGMAPGTHIAIHHPRTVAYLAAVLACFKLNCPYVPVDPSYPTSYAMRTLLDAQPTIVVTTRELARALRLEERQALLLDADPAARPLSIAPAFAPPTTRPDDIAYIAYTSGSTGEPKGVVVEHRQLSNCLHALWERTPFEPGEIVAQKTSMSFVPSIKEMLSGLLVGVPQVIFSDHVVKDAPAFARAVREHGITRLNLVPSHLDVLLDFADCLAGLRHVTTAGEPLSRRLSERFAAALPSAKLHNNYGCSELNDICYASGKDLEGDTSSIPAGRAISNCRVHLLDHALMPVPVGAIGQIFVEGASVGPGYWNRPDLTAERFVRHSSGARMLRTGDLGRWLPDGQLLHLGREDFQIKVRGQRVELPAVELALTSHPDVEAGAAVGRAHNETAQLAAFYVAKRGAHLDGNTLHAWLERRVPAHMVPTRFVALDTLPVLPNGKLNRLALAAMNIGDAQSSAGPAAQAGDAPRGTSEGTIARIWCDALGIERIGRDDNFFALGGDSLTAARVAARIGQALHVPLTVRDIFDTRSVHALAAYVDAERARTKSGAPSGNEGAPSEDFLAFNASGTQSPLFLAHTLQGYSWYFGHLAAHIDSDIPVYGLPPTRLGAAPPRTLEAIAARFVEIMKSIQPTGRYRIAGWSFGGLIAYEIATQLIQRGDEVEFLGLFDTTLPARPAQVDAQRSAVLALYSFAVNNFSAFDPQSIDFEEATNVDVLIETIVESIEARRRTSVPLWHLAYDTPDENRAFLRRLVAHGLAMNEWTAKPIDVKVHVFAAQDTSITPLEGHTTLPDRLGWTAVLAPSNIEVVAVPGNHETIVKFHADALGRYIGEVLTAASVVE